jgi:hypothetical protein
MGSTQTQTNATEQAPTQYAPWPPAPPKQAVPQYFPPPNYPPPGPRPDFPASGPIPVPSAEKPGGSRWVLPTVIFVAAALVLGAIGVIIGLVAKMNSTPASTTAESTTFPSYGLGPTATSTTTRSIPTPTTESLPSGNIPPPLVTGQDLGPNHQTCDGGYHLTNRSGFGTRGGRGTPQTSCFFADSMLRAYWDTYGNASMTPRPVSAQGAVPCNSIPGASCDPGNSAMFRMQCAGDGPNPWIKCTGGNNAVVYLW